MPAVPPTDKTIPAFLNASEGAVGYPRLLKEFAATLEEERVLKKMLKKLSAAGLILKLKGKRYAKMPAPPAGGAAVLPEASPASPASPGKPAGRKSAGKPVREKSGPDGAFRAQIVREGKFLFALVGEGKKKIKYVIPKSKDPAPRPGASALVKPLDRNGPFGYPAARVIPEDRPTIEFAQVSRAFFKEWGVPLGYPKRALQEAQDFPEPSADSLAAGLADGRMDLRGEHVVTIDPADAKDHDDAISLKKSPDGSWSVGVHIADVSEYVRMDGPLDEEALHRSYTQYLPWTAAPMLPQRLSGDLCSLLEGKDRLAFSCFMEVTPQGDLRRFEFRETVINVARFYSYEEAQKLKEEGDKPLSLLCEFTDLLFARRKEEGYLDFQLPEPKVVLNASREPEDIRPGVRLPSHGWVEECMLLANRACAQHIHKHKIPGLYRVHEQPDIEVVAELWSHQESLQGKVAGAEDILKLRETEGFLNPRVQQFYVKLLDPSRGVLPPAVQRKILQSMNKAQYSASPLGHFALGWQYYAHFTSPIRRYSDLWTHRMMKLHAHGLKIPRPMGNRAIAIAEEISAREIAVVKVERKAMRVATAWIFRNHVGREFLGEISGVESFGFFVTVTDPYGEGMVPVARMRDDYYEKDPLTGHLVGRRHHRRFELGQKVRVRVTRSDPFTAQVDFEYLGAPARP